MAGCARAHSHRPVGAKASILDLSSKGDMEVSQIGADMGDATQYAGPRPVLSSPVESRSRYPRSPLPKNVTVTLGLVA